VQNKEREGKKGLKRMKERAGGKEGI